MAFVSVRGLEQNYPILVLFYGEGDVTSTLVAILTKVRRALESILGQILAGNVKLQHQKSCISMLSSSASKLEATYMRWAENSDTIRLLLEILKIS